MKYSAAVLSLAAVAVAKPAFTNLSFNVVEGEPFTLEFTGCEGGCTIILKNGERGDLQDVQELTSSAEGGSFTFTLDSVPSDTYTFEIVNNETGEDNYSQQFVYEGEAAEPTTAVETETMTSSVVVTMTTATSTEETTPSSTEESTSMTTPMSSASTTVTETETETSSATATDDTTPTTSGDDSTETSEIPNPDDAAVALGSPMTLVVAAVAGLLMFN